MNGFRRFGNNTDCYRSCVGTWAQVRVVGRMKHYTFTDASIQRWYDKHDDIVRVVEIEDCEEVEAGGRWLTREDVEKLLRLERRYHAMSNDEIGGLYSDRHVKNLRNAVKNLMNSWFGKESDDV